jgi:hypothetical protein
MKIKTLFYTSKLADGIKPLLTSLAYKQYDYSFIAPKERFIGFGCKLLAIKDHVENYVDRSYTHIMVLDAWDLIIIKGNHKGVFIDEYTKWFRESDIVFNAESECWPDKELINSYPISSQYMLFRYLNAGAWISPIEYIHQLCSVSPKTNDQRHFTKLYLDNINKVNSISLSKNINIRLDHDCHIFQTLHGVPESIFKLRKYQNKEKYEFINTLSNTKPFILHGNGRVDMSNYINKLL